MGLSLAHRYATFLCSWDVDSLVGQLTSLSLSRIQMVTSGKREPDYTFDELPEIVLNIGLTDLTGILGFFDNWYKVECCILQNL